MTLLERSAINVGMKTILLKKLLLPLVLTAALPFALSAQNATDTYDLGSRKVKIPTPDGFINATSQFPSVTARIRATEDPGNDLLAVTVPESFVPKLKISEDIDLEFYAKVSVSKRARAIDITKDNFAALIASFEKNFGAYIEPGGPLMTSVEKNSEKGLTELLGKDTPISINETKYLGVIEKSDDVFSGMMLVSFEMYGRKMTTLGTLAFLRVNQRLVFVYAYRMSPSGNSVKELTQLTKKWTAKIIAANK